MLGILVLAGASAGCHKTPEGIPSSWLGRYRRTTAMGLVADQFVVVGPTTLTVQACQINCGEPVVNMQNIHCGGPYGQEVCNWTSTHCTGTISHSTDDRISITATPTPTTATGPELGTHNLTCINVRIGLGSRATE